MSATIVEAVVKLATKVKGETVVPKNATIAAALDALADALAGENVQAKPTIASAIDMITENYTPGGGGGGSFGPFATVLNEGTSVPEVGNHMDGIAFINSVGVGDSVICVTDGTYSIAAGATAITPGVLSTDFTALDAYVCTVEGSDDDGWTYKTVEKWDGTITRTEFESGGLTGYRWSFVVPELQEDELLMLWMYVAA